MLKLTKFAEQEFVLSAETMFLYHIMTYYHLPIVSEQTLISASQDVSVIFNRVHTNLGNLEFSGRKYYLFRL